MTVTTITSREFNQDVSRAKRVAKAGPVFITDRGRPAHVLLTIEDYQAITGGRRSLADAMSAPGLSSIDFDPPRFDVKSRPTDLD
ncbi:MAG: type II toxin-antitoxin system Phd/YefM family antitoxin [Pseudomonadota bacterium]